jgi:2-polyprenyl-6-methoxyphenol hydroxylase-like FAD-dependent oxidoreductase
VPNNVGVSRRDLHEALNKAAESTGLRVRYGTTADEVVDGPEGVDVKLSDGTSKRYDLVVAFDGIKSPLRRKLFGDSYDPVHTGYGACRVTMPRPAEMTQGTVYQGINAKVGCIPLSQNEMYLFMVTPEPKDARFTQEQLRDLLRARLADFEGPPAVVRDALTEESEIIYGALNEVMLPAPWHRGRILIAGDAAHACSPHITQGAAMAIEDGVVLGEEMRADRPLAEALDAFSARRFPRAQFVQAVSRAILDAEMQVTSEEALEHAVEHMRAELVGQNTGVDAFLGQPA